MRWTVLAFVACSVGAHASYELALIVDAGNRRIQRYDPISDTLLGSFGSRYLNNPSRICVSQSAGLAYVIDGLAIKTFNYSTGELIGGFSFSSGVFPTNIRISRPGFNLYTVSVGGTTSVAEISASGVSGNTLSFVGGHTVRSAVYSTKGLYYSISTSLSAGTYTYYVNRHNGGGSVVQTSTLFTSTSLLSTELATDNNSLYVATGLGGNPAGNNRRINLATDGSILSTTAASNSGWDASHILGGTAFGHAGVAYWTASTTAGSTWLYTYEPLTNFFSYSSLKYTGTANDIAIVVAPEPGSLTAVALGTLALIVRRRRG